MKIIVSGGGTGGHIFPAIAIANAVKLLQPDAEILFVGAEGRMEMERVPNAGYKIIGLPVAGFYRSLTYKNLIVLWKLYKSLRKAAGIIESFKPDVVVGVGGYASGPVLKAAVRKGVPALLQEQNSYAGVTNKLLAKQASVICTAYDGMGRFFPSDKIILTGNPIRKNLLDASNLKEEGYRFYELDASKKTILIVGGSLGARTLNESLLQVWDKLVLRTDIQIIWQTGAVYFESIIEKLPASIPSHIKVLKFIDRMDLAYSISDLVVSRAGAGTISELCLLKKAVVLVPSPNVSEDHQTKNAMALVNKNAAIMVKDSAAKDMLGATMLSLISNNDELTRLSNNIAKLGIANSDDLIAKEVLKLVRK